MIDITSDSYWDLSWPWAYSSEESLWTLENGWFMNDGRYSPPFGATHISQRLVYIGESLIGKSMLVYNNHIGIVVNYSSYLEENSGYWGSNEYYDADYVQTIGGVAAINLTKDVYGIGVLVTDDDGYVDLVQISEISLGESSVWTNFRNTVEVTA